MAAYAATVTLRQRSAIPLGGGIGFVHGTINVTNYNQTLAEITGVSGLFKGAPTVILGGITSGGYGARWVPASKSVYCYTFPDAAGVAAQAASDTNPGTVEFAAFGVIGR